MSVLFKRFQHVHVAGSSHYVYEGVAAFAGTDTSVELVVPDIKVIRVHSLCPIGNGVGAEQPSINETIADDGGIAVPASGSITITRPAGTTSGLKFSFRIEG